MPHVPTEDNLALSLMEIFAQVGKGLTKDQMLYWQRNPGKLQDLLTRDTATFLGCRMDSFEIPAVPTMSIKEAFEGPRLFYSRYGLQLPQKRLDKVQPATAPAMMMECAIQCALHPSEIIDYLFSIDSLLASDVTVPQIRAIVDGSDCSEDDFQYLVRFAAEKNYFPIRTNDGIVIAELKLDTRQKKWFLGEVLGKNFLDSGRLFLKRPIFAL